jgi:hypothetical protein
MANLKLKPEKSQLFRQEILFLEHKVSTNVILPDSGKIKAVSEWQRPVNAFQICQYLGLCSYNRRWIKNFATKAQALTHLTSKNIPFEWTTACEISFQTLKAQLISAPLLANPVDYALYVLDTDVSLCGVGCVLQQEQQGVLRVIAYASRTLKFCGKKLLHDPSGAYCNHLWLKTVPPVLIRSSFCAADRSCCTHIFEEIT